MPNNKIVSISDPNSFITLEAGKSELTPEMIRTSILEMEKKMSGLPAESKIALETMHTFAEGLYSRTVYMKAGSLFTGKIHKKEHIVVISQGSCSVVSEEFGSRLICAPMVFMSPPLVKRLLFVHTDSIWTTVHKNPTNTRDLDILEKDLMLESYEGVLP